MSYLAATIFLLSSLIILPVAVSLNLEIKTTTSFGFSYFVAC
jgi:hypothetical protein